MKYEPLWCRESSLQWFRRRCVSLHGFVVFFKPLRISGNEAPEKNGDKNDMDSDRSSDRIVNYDNMKSIEQ